MRVLLACSAFPPYGKGGGPASSRLLALALAHRGAVVRVLTIGSAPGDETREGYEVRVLPSLNVYWDYWQPKPVSSKVVWHALENFNPRAFSRMRTEIRQFAPDIVFTVSIENINVATWLAAKMEGVPVAHMLYGYFLLCWRGTMFHRRSNCIGQCHGCRLTSLGKRVLSGYVDGVLGESKFVIDVHVKAGLFKSAAKAVLPAAVTGGSDLDLVPSTGHALRVGYIGLHSPNKGIDTLAQAARLLQNDPVIFKIAGTGKDDVVTQLRQQFPADNTSFLGWIPAERFYGEVDIIVVPSISNEAFGRVSVEPLPYGVPVIAARSGGLPENVMEGHSGYLFPAGDHGALADHIQRLAYDRELLQRLRAGARTWARRYEFEPLAQELEEFLIHVCQRRSGESPAKRHAPC